MRMFKGPSIKQKLTSIIILTSCIALLLACFAFIVYDRYTYKAGMKTNVRMLAQVIGGNATSSLSFDRPDDAAHLLTSLQVEDEIYRACIYDSMRQFFAGYPSYVDGSEFPNLVDLQSRIEFDHSYMYVYEAIVLENKITGLIFIQSKLFRMNRRLKQYIYIASLFVLASIFVVSTISLRLQHIISTPIMNLASVAREVSQKQDFSIRAKKYSRDELGFLTERFNEMLNQIQDRDKALQHTYDELQKNAFELESELKDRRAAEEKLVKSLKEKEVLLREIHHRVKNNLQVISSLIYLQTKNISDVEALRLFRDGQNRVKSMALIHEELYNSKDLSHIDFAAYIKNLSSHLFHSYREESKAIRLESDVEAIALSIDTAVNCGMIINELVTNSLKHGFQNKKGGKIWIKLHALNGNDYEMRIGDNGAGIPDRVDFRNTTSLGLQLVCNLTDQLSGTIELDTTGGGTEFKILFSESN